MTTLYYPLNHCLNPKTRPGCPPCTALQAQGPDGKWNKFTGRYAWDASWLCSNEAEQYGGTGEHKPAEMVFPAAPNLDHSQVCERALHP